MIDGLVRGTVRVVEYDGRWPEEARKTISLLEKILQQDMVRAEHVGSTAIPGICAKPILDIAVGVMDFQDIRKHDPDLLTAGIHFRKEEHGEQLLYVCGDLQKDLITHHIHAVIWGSDAWTNYLNFRDYLKCSGEDASAYAELKKKLAEQFQGDRGSYTAGKQECIEKILRKAALWRWKINSR